VDGVFFFGRAGGSKSQDFRSEKSQDSEVIKKKLRRKKKEEKI
jgi:hypothetical protein